MKLITDVFTSMVANKQVIYIQSFLKAMQLKKCKMDCKVYNKEDGQFIQVKGYRLNFGYEENEDREDRCYAQSDLNAALMKEFAYLFTIFLENFSIEYDQQDPTEVAES